MIEDIQNKLQDIRNPVSAMAALIREMDLETDSEPGGEGPLTTGKLLDNIRPTNANISTQISPR